jgi:hypothetical protein
MITTLNSLRLDVLRHLDEATNTSSHTTALVGDMINRAHRRICSEYPWSFMLWPRVETLTCVVGQHQYNLHPEYGRPFYFRNRATREYLEEVPRRALPQEGADWINDAGHPKHFAFWGRQFVTAQPSSVSTLSLVSSSASDTGANYHVLVKGVTSAGILDDEEVELTGTSPVATTKSFETIIGITKSRAFNGRLTITSNSGAVTVLTLEDDEMGRAHQTIYLIESPTEADVLEYRFFRHPLALINDYDVPEIPYPHTDVLVYETLMEMTGYLSGSANINIWRERRDEALQGLQQAYLEGQSLEAQPRFVRDMDGEPSAPWPLLT